MEDAARKKQEEAKFLRGMFLGMDRERQLNLLKDIYREKGFGAYMVLAKIALEAPCNRGGIPTEDLDEIYQELLGEA